MRTVLSLSVLRVSACEESPCRLICALGEGDIPKLDRLMSVDMPATVPSSPSLKASAGKVGDGLGLILGFKEGLGVEVGVGVGVCVGDGVGIIDGDGLGLDDGHVFVILISTGIQSPLPAPPELVYLRIRNL